jgi:multicomponent Na+:H+ antiporter subunit B
METFVNVVLLAFLGITAIVILRLRSLFAVAMLSGIYSLVSACIFVVLDAVDVAFTEASVGAGITTVLMLGTLALTKSHEKIPVRTPLLPLVVVVLTGAVLMYGTLGMPAFGDPEAPINRHVAPRYIEGTLPETGIPNVVTSVLASYRGYDTLGETTVIFTAGIGVMLLLGRIRRRRGAEPPPESAGGGGGEP